MIQVPEKRAARGAVLSDLHLFTDRSTAHQHLEEIHETAAASDLFIFNGDTFDFAWSHHRRFEKSVGAAIEWITDLTTEHPHCSFVYLLGNHDGIALFKEALSRLTATRPNLYWEPYHLQLGRKMFLHGDALHSCTTPEHLEAYRQKWDKPEQTHRKLTARAYRMAAYAGIPTVLIRLNSKRRCARRILCYLRSSLDCDARSVEEVYFGHTHRAFEDYKYHNRTFHNTGAALTRVRLNILHFEFSGEPLQFSDGREVACDLQPADAIRPDPAQDCEPPSDEDRGNPGSS